MSKGLEIRLSYIPVINFALQQNHVPVIREIVLRNTGDEQVDDIDLAVNFEPEFALEYSQHLDSLAPGMSKRISVIWNCRAGRKTDGSIPEGCGRSEMMRLG